MRNFQIVKENYENMNLKIEYLGKVHNKAFKTSRKF